MPDEKPSKETTEKPGEKTTTERSVQPGKPEVQKEKTTIERDRERQQQQQK